jgi:cation diffusion facilitator family transporter
LAVNLASAWLLRNDPRTHNDGQGQQWGHRHNHADHNIRAAYAHVMADALTSVLAIMALVAGRFRGWIWMDPVIGVVGALVIAYWSAGLIRSAGAVLLDTMPDASLAGIVRERLETGSDRVSDLHMWRVGPGHVALIVAIVSDRPLSPAIYKRRLEGIEGLSHVTVEVQPSDENETPG